jgi:tripartite-type tricarboxylate transporter receptor subunit TctC
MLERILARMCFAALAVAASTAAFAQSYPERPVKIIVPFSPGGSTDVTARLIADGLSRQFHQQFIVENRPGAAGAIGVVAKSNPDGYTLGLSGVGPTAVIPIVDPKLNYNPSRDLDVVAGLSAVDLMLAVRPNFPGTTLKEVLDYAAKNPGR